MGRMEPAEITIQPRGLSRVQAARYVGVCPVSFDTMVANGEMPNPKTWGRRLIWDRLALDVSFEALPDRRRRNPFDETETGEAA